MAAFWSIISAINNLWAAFKLLMGFVKAVELKMAKKENSEAVDEAIETGDQRRAEAALGNPNPGRPTGRPGTELRDSLPGVSDPKGS